MSQPHRPGPGDGQQLAGGEGQALEHRPRGHQQGKVEHVRPTRAPKHDKTVPDSQQCIQDAQCSRGLEMESRLQSESGQQDHDNRGDRCRRMPYDYGTQAGGAANTLVLALDFGHF